MSSHALLASLVTTALLSAACGPMAPLANEPAAETPATPAETATPAADAPAPEEAQSPAEPAAPKGPTQADLDKEMTPPEGLADLRPVLGTDPAQAMPAIFAQVKKGMTAKDLDAVFPGLGAIPKIAFVTFTKQGNKWVRVKGNQKHKELLDLAYDDDGGLKKISYMFDPATVKPELWPYLAKSAAAKWGKADSDGDLRTWKKDGVEISVTKTDDKTVSIDLVF